MRVLDLFAGIGGFSLAAHWMGWETVAFVEKDKFCQKVLAKNFPDVPIYGDIFEFDGKPFRGSVDVVCGGFPCQPFSHAGRRKGKHDDRHLFPEMLRVISEVRPCWIVAENVRGLLSIHDGELFEEIAALMEGQNYEVQAFCVPASSVNAPHKRDRVWLIAHAERNGLFAGEESRSPNASIREKPARSVNAFNVTRTSGLHTVADASSGASRDDTRADRNATADIGRKVARDVFTGLAQHSADPDFAGLQGRMLENGSERPQSNDKQSIRCGRDWSESWLQVAAEFCRVDDVVPNRVDRLRSLGNAVVPQLVYEIFQAIETSEG